jgi:hypothetical protein
VKGRGSGPQLFELVELDPATGQEDQLMSPAPGTWKQVAEHRDSILMDVITDWDDGRATWPILVIQPAQ